MADEAVLMAWVGSLLKPCITEGTRRPRRFPLAFISNGEGLTTWQVLQDVPNTNLP